MSHAPQSLETLPWRVVLDTNVVLDLLVFADPRARPLSDALQAGRLSAITSNATLFELTDVLARPFLAPWGVPAESVLATLQRWGQCIGDIPAPPAPPSPRCRDGDDQKFVDLALATQARWLISHDRAVLALAKRARQRGLHILTPQAWATGQSLGVAQGT